MTTNYERTPLLYTQQQEQQQEQLSIKCKLLEMQHYKGILSIASSFSMDILTAF